MTDRPLNILVALAFLLVALTMAFYYFLSAEVMTRLYKTEIDPNKIYLSFGGVFCQESHILDEWIKHHLAEGVQHFFLIDNCNTAKDQAVLKPYVDEGIVTLMINTTKYAQVELYQYVLVPAAMGKTEWLIVGDLDEFYYAPFQSTIPAVIKNNFEHCPAITIPEIKFGSSGNNATPPSIVDANIMRINYDTHEADVRAHCKVIIRMSHLKRIAIHSHEYKQEQLSCLAFENNYYLTTRTAGGTYPLRELDLQKLVIRYNHYAVQSREYFFGVKATRGDVHHEDRNHYRDDNYFKRADYNEIIDLTLKNKKKKRTTAAKGGRAAPKTEVI